MATHRFILSAGHRNTDGGGAWKGPESAWTYPICKKLKAAIERRGGEAWIIQEEDGDRDPSFSVGRGLQNAAALCVDLAKVVGGADAYISMHYGAEPVDGFFSIYPDAHSGVDVAANNPLDIQLCRTFAKHVKKTGMPIRGDGTMSERRSGVGIQGYRLGEFVGTIGFRSTTARVIVEAGNSLSPAEYNLMWSPSWQEKYVEALVDGLEEVFGAFPETGETTEPVKEEPEKPVAQYPDAHIIEQVQDGRPFVALDNRSVLVKADVVVRATKETPRLRYATPASEHIGPLIGKGETFSVDYLIVNPDQTLYWYSPWGTRIHFEDTEIVSPE